MATVNFLYRSSKPQAQLTIRFLYRDKNKPSETINKKTKEIRQLPYTDNVLNGKTKETVLKEVFTNNKRNQTAEHKEQKLVIEKELLKIEKHILRQFSKDYEIIEINQIWLNKVIEKYYNPKQITVEVYYIKYWIDYIINTADKRKNAKNGVGLSYNTIKGYKDIKEVVNRYQTLDTTKVLSLNSDWFESFFDWLIFNQNYSRNTAIKKINILKSVITESSKKIEVPNYKNFKRKAINTYDEDTDVITLTIEDLEKIEKAKLNSIALNNARKYLILACYTGQRGTALIERIKAENFVKKGNNYTIEIKQIKGGKKVIIPVLPKTKEIYEKGMPYKVSTQKLNEHFKTICELAEINEPILGKKRNKETNRNEKKIRPKYEYISTHTGRRTFATIHYNKIPTTAIMKVTGHLKVSTFLKYIQKDTTEHIDEFEKHYYKDQDKTEKRGNLKVIKRTSNS